MSDATSPLDEPESGRRVEVTITFPEGSSDEDVAAGVGMETSLVGTEVSAREILLSVLRVAETLAAEAIREERRPSTLLQRDEDTEMALTYMNARLMVTSLLIDMPLTPSTSISFSA